MISLIVLQAKCLYLSSLKKPLLSLLKGQELRWLMVVKCITTNRTKDFLFPVQELKVVNFYITYLIQNN